MTVNKLASLGGLEESCRCRMIPTCVILTGSGLSPFTFALSEIGSFQKKTKSPGLACSKQLISSPQWICWLALRGRDLPKRDIVRCDRLEETMKTYDKIYRVSKSVGNLETPIYNANIELERITDKKLPELITDLQTTFKAWNIGEKKNQRGLMVVQPKNTATQNHPKALPASEQPKALPAPEQPKALPAPKKEPVLLLPWFGNKKD